MALYIYAESPELRRLLSAHVLQHRWTDSGFDIPMVGKDMSAEVVSSTLNMSIHLGIKVAVLDDQTNETRPCLLLPRSSIGKTPYRMTNSLGLIDQGYRGEVQAKVDCVGVPASWEDGARMFQLCRHNFLPWTSVTLVSTESDLPVAPDTRGEGGFGSTG